MRPQLVEPQPPLTQSQPSSEFTLSHSSLPPPPPESLIRRPEAQEAVGAVISIRAGIGPSPFGAKQSDVEVPAPKKKTAVNGNASFGFWATEGPKVAAPVKNQAAPLNGFAHASHPAGTKLFIAYTHVEIQLSLTIQADFAAAEVSAMPGSASRSRSVFYT